MIFTVLLVFCLSNNGEAHTFSELRKVTTTSVMEKGSNPEDRDIIEDVLEHAQSAIYGLYDVIDYVKQITDLTQNVSEILREEGKLMYFKRARTKI